MAKIKYSQGVYNSLKQRLKKEIIQAKESDPELRKEIARVFQMANRRIQNIEQKGQFSPALQALNKGNIQSFTKFGMKQTWTELKKSYSEAISFLNQPTSTSTGTTQYNETLRKRYDLSPVEYQAISDRYFNKITSLTGSAFVEKYLMRYKDYTSEMEQETKSVGDQIESESVKLSNELQKQIDTEAENVSQQWVDGMKKLEQSFYSAFDNIMKGFKM